VARPKKRRQRVARQSGASREAVQSAPPSDSTSTVVESPATPTGSPRQIPKGVWMATIALVAVWWAFLMGLAWLTANPVTLNYRQIEDSRYVVTGRVANLSDGTVEVEREWRREEPLEVVRVEDLKRSGAVEGQTYLIPLRPNGDGLYRVTPTPRVDAVPPIYPATDAAIGQLESILQQLAEPDEEG